MAAVEEGVLYADMSPLDQPSFGRFVVPGKISGPTVDCFVYVPETKLARGKAPKIVYVAIGRVVRLPVARLQNQKLYAPVARPYVIRRDDGHEISYA
jgi:hypothetical protein